MNEEKLLNDRPPLPKKLDDWIRKECVRNTFLFYSKKSKTAVCSRCGAVYSIDKNGYCAELDETFAHNKEMECHSCWKSATARAKGLGRKELTETFRIMVYTRSGNSLFGSLYEVWIEFKEDRPNIDMWLSAVYKFNKNEQIYLKHEFSYVGDDIWRNRSNNIKLPSPPNNAMGYSRFWALYTYPHNLESVFNIPALKNADVLDVCEKYNLSEYGRIYYLPLAINFSSLELLRKAGLNELFKQKILGETPSRACNWKATNLRKILRVKTKKEMREIREQNFGLKELLVYQSYNKNGKVCPARLIPLLINARADRIKKYMTIDSAAEYIYRQRTMYPGKYITISDYDDYIVECEKLSYDLTQKKTLKPKNFLKAHKRTSELCREIIEKADNDKLAESTLKIVKTDTPFVYKDLLIRPALSIGELRREGEALGHCVASYTNRIIKGQCVILFIRKAKKPNKAFYTLEVNADGKLLQCRGNGNIDMTKEVKEFVNIWLKEFKKRKKVA